MTPIHGNTYPIRGELKKLGGRWDPENKCWRVPSRHAEKAFRLLDKVDPGAGMQKRCTECREPIPRHRTRCVTCFVGPQVKKRQKLIDLGFDLAPIRVPSYK